MTIDDQVKEEGIGKPVERTTWKELAGIKDEDSRSTRVLKSAGTVGAYAVATPIVITMAAGLAAVLAVDAVLGIPLSVAAEYVVNRMDKRKYGKQSEYQPEVK